MVTKAEMHKKMIRTVLDQLSPYIEYYSPEDQVLLIEFLNLLSNFEKADKNRTELINNYESYTKKILETTEYNHTPFLWFTVAYFQKARLTLNWTNFQANSFYEYLSKFLRKNPSYFGVYELIRKQIPLSDDKWEQLQYACTKMLKPLSKEQMKIIQGLIAIIKNKEISALNPRMLKKNLSPLFPMGTKIDKILTEFVINLESMWHLNYHSPAFGIEKIFIHIEGIKSKIKEFINFQDTKNTILCLSDIYVSRDHSKDYIGILYVPTQDVKSLTTFMKNHEQRGTFKIKSLSKIETSYRSLSLERYIVDKGWPVFGRGDLQKISKLIKDAKEEKDTETGTLTYIASQFNQKWQFDQHQLPLELVKTYCDVPTRYEYSALPLPLSNEKEEKNITKTNIGLLKQLNYNNVLSIDWIPWRLVNEFSLDIYWIKMPRKFLNKVIHLLKIVPFSTVYLSDDKIYLWLHLTPQIVQWIKSDFQWEIIPISYYSTPQTPNFNWFNQEKSCWKTPRILDPNTR